jgi:hypothetical protein
VKAGADHLVIPKRIYTFLGPQNCDPDQYRTRQLHCWHDRGDAAMRYLSTACLAF